MRPFLLILALLGLVPTQAAVTFPVTIRVEDTSGAVTKEVLVIVQDLDNSEREIVRTLSDQSGNVSPLQLPPGLYRVIATAPYGIWQTSVREFLVGPPSNAVIVKVQPMSTHGNGDIVTMGSTQAHLQVIGPEGQAASGARVFIRDREATLHLERWYKTNAKGTANIELFGDVTVVVVVYGDVLQTTELGRQNLNPTIRLQKH
jgi:hypothetical protein